MGAPPASAHRDAAGTRRHLTSVLLAAQVFGSTAHSLTLAVGGVVAVEVSGTAATSGLPVSVAALGTAIASLPLSWLMARRGRRSGLALGYALAVVGSMLCLVGTLTLSFPLLLAGVALFGVGNASNLLSRFAAADVTPPAERGRAIGLILGGATAGSFLGPSLLEPTTSLGLALGIRGSASAFLIGIGGFGLAAVAIELLLRPDPLVVAERLRRTAAGSVPVAPPRQIRTILALVPVRVAVCTLMVSQVVMIATTAIGPFYLHTHGHGVQMVGLAASLHLSGMFAASPITGALSDRFGRLPIMMIGSGVLLVAVVGAAVAPGSDGLLVSALLFLNGVGWNFAFVASSALLTDSLSPAERPTIQGAADLATGLMGALGSALGGYVLHAWGFRTLNVAGALIVLVALVAARAFRSAAAESRASASAGTAT